MTEETFNKAWDIMSDRGKYKDQLEWVNKILSNGVKSFDIGDIFRISPNLKTDIMQDIEKRLRAHAETLQTCIDLCNEQLNDL